MEKDNIRQRNGSPTFYDLLKRIEEIHDRKSHDYASNKNPYGNYHFAGELGQLFKNPHDAGFIARVGEKLFRLANLENEGKFPSNESIEDTEIDIVTIIALWIASRRDARLKKREEYLNNILNIEEHKCLKCNKSFIDMHLYAKHAEDMHAAIYDDIRGTLKFNDTLEVLPNFQFKK